MSGAVRDGASGVASTATGAAGGAACALHIVVDALIFESVAEVRAAQQEDELCTAIRAVMAGGRELDGVDVRTRRACDAGEYTVDDLGVVWHRNTAERSGHRQLVVPAAFRVELMRAVHDDLLATSMRRRRSVVSSHGGTGRACQLTCAGMSSGARSARS